MPFLGFFGCITINDNKKENLKNVKKKIKKKKFEKYENIRFFIEILKIFLQIIFLFFLKIDFSIF